jgi:acetyltransferase-like isoleucine patch superfamily enzyme
LIHPTAIIEKNVNIGEGTKIWDNVHIRYNSSIGNNCIVGEKTYIAYNVKIGNFVKINAFVYIPTGIIIEDKVMISAGCIFVNDHYPRAYDTRTNKLSSSKPNEKTLDTIVCEGATLGAGTIILADLRIGKYALVGAGSVVTKSVFDHALVVGNPARQIGWVCICGPRLNFDSANSTCESCKRSYAIIDNQCVVIEK